MIDRSVKLLLQEAINSPAKLQILLLFHENPCMEATATQLAQRACRDIWSVDEALSELAADNILAVSQIVNGKDPIYSYRPAAHHIDVIKRLARYYEDPLKRDLLHRSVRELASFASFRRQGAWYPSIA